ncbi:MAG: inositol monophosphatase, partial [Actinobacteria bacterium]|nr:inositol monophosphatase [Actinomycetota bacterium]
MVDHDAVGEQIREIADRLVLPRFRKLVEGDVEEKSPGDLVTVVDVEVERELTAYLRGLGGTSVVVGEEAVAADPGVLEAGRRAERAWVIDPIDGTR